MKKLSVTVSIPIIATILVSDNAPPYALDEIKLLIKRSIPTFDPREMEDNLRDALRYHPDWVKVSKGVTNGFSVRADASEQNVVITEVQE